MKQLDVRSFAFGCALVILFFLFISASDGLEDAEINRYQTVSTANSVYITDTKTGVTKQVYFEGMGGIKQLNLEFKNMK